MLCWCARVLQLGVLVLTVAAQATVNVRPCETEGYGPPRNLTATPVGYSALYVSWEPPDVEPQYYAIIADNLFDRKDVNTSNTFVLLENLTCCCTYTIYAGSVYGDDENCFTTIDATPNQPRYGPPRNLTATPVGYFALNVSWEPPDVEPQYYAIHAYSGYDEQRVNTSNTFVHFEDLRCCCSYTIIAVSIYGDGKKCQAFIDITPSQPLPKQPDSCSIHIWHSTTVEVTEHGGGDECPWGFNYFATWNWVVLWSNETGNYTGSLIHSVDPYTNVTATVFVDAHNVTGTPPSCSVVTPQTQSSPPTNLSITSPTHKTRTLSWSLPDHINGVLKGWLLNWGKLGEALDGQVQLEPHYRAYTMEDIDPGYTYGVNIMAINGAGLGSRASIGITRKHDPGLTTTLAICGSLIGIVLLVGIYRCSRNIKRRRATSTTQVQGSYVDHQESSHDL
ncbi:receptor-type tyrosine-protein phosphatase H isoform X1 [Procambarus clarkii]|uniref:receptor-type tyrosine-protein phosphatase H isoform X1 n=1 Tax=Procambarus clarkii TaxID=6728 RepID=UPI00374470A2